jgi:pilus assembly protein CpaC
LEEEINRAFPDSHVHLFLVGDQLAVSGQAKDVHEATQILRIVRANAPGTTEAPAQLVREQTVEAVPTGYSFGGALQTLETLRTVAGPNVINLLRVPGEQQVMLRVTVAEVNRAAARSIGLNFSLTNDQGITYFQNLTGNIAGTTSGGGGGTQVAPSNNLPALLDNGQIALAINALRTLNFARSLAEPTLTTLNGQSADFHAGGAFPVPIVTGFFGTGQTQGLQGVQYIPFGVSLQFIPYVTDRDRIRLQIQAEVSTRDLQTVNVSGSQVPTNLNSRDFQTTVEMREGQTLAVAGLLQTNYGANSSRVPFFGDLPFVGRLFAFDQTSTGEQELVVLITPELVRPVDPDKVPSIPGSDLFEPGDLEFYLLGRLESRRMEDYRSPVRTDIHRMLRYRHCDDVYIGGPLGFSDGRW